MDVMTSNPLLIAASTSIAAALQRMRTAGVRCVPVAGARNELIGVLSIDDVLDAVAEQFTAISSAIRGGRAREQVMRP